ncbi:acyl transferase/acyl hydrolase/lysophospholipase [Blastocladiella britannica]|nr:acyl transferase/acyl hydrolase/lysophospholipase [Blastocladiella britannica]
MAPPDRTLSPPPPRTARSPGSVDTTATSTSNGNTSSRASSLPARRPPPTRPELDASADISPPLSDNDDDKTTPNADDDDETLSVVSDMLEDHDQYEFQDVDPAAFGTTALVVATNGSKLAASTKRAAAGATVKKAARLLKPRPDTFSFHLLRWPLIVGIALILMFELAVYFTLRAIVRLYEDTVVWTGARAALRKALRAARSRTDWEKAAAALDTHLGGDAWKRTAASGDYDYRLVRALAARMRKARRGPTATRQSSSLPPPAARTDTAAVVDPLSTAQPPYHLEKLRDLCLESACKSNIGGIERNRLYASCYLGTKDLVNEFVDETVAAIESLAAALVDPMAGKRSGGSELGSAWKSQEDKIKFFKEATGLYGKTALCLSGGATFAYAHLGVVRTLFEAGMLPKIITGTSAGSLIAAIICTRTDPELKDLLHPKTIYPYLTACDTPWLTRMLRFYQKGALFDVDHWATKMKWATTPGDLTFQEAYEKTGRVLNISVVTGGRDASQKILNYKTSPNVVVWSAVLASSAVPGVIDPVQLRIKRKRHDGRSVVEPFGGWSSGRFQDGSLLTDIPLKALHQQFNVNYTIVSQCNPHVSAFFYAPQGGSGDPTAHRGGRGWRGGFIASTVEHYLKLDLRKWLKIIRDTRVLPPLLSADFSSVWLQRFHGNCNIVPRATLTEWVHILDDPNVDRMERYFSHGERATWPALKSIENRIRIERAIERARASVTNSLV